MYVKGRTLTQMEVQQLAELQTQNQDLRRQLAELQTQNQDLQRLLDLLRQQLQGRQSWQGTAVAVSPFPSLCRRLDAALLQHRQRGAARRHSPGAGSSRWRWAGTDCI
jgi:FtsZ-binding cell division protein ZapB